MPVDVAASGPRVIEVAARLADAVTFAVGVDPDRLRLGRRHRRARRAPPPGWTSTASGSARTCPVFVHDDRAVARRMVSGGVGSYARFSVMHGTVAGPVAESQRGTLEAVHEAYDMNAHFTHGSPQSKALTDEVIDAFAIAGPPSYCLERFAELAEMGLRRFFVMGPGRGADEDDAAAVAPPLRREVLPNVLA